MRTKRSECDPYETAGLKNSQRPKELQKYMSAQESVASGAGNSLWMTGQALIWMLFENLSLKTFCPVLGISLPLLYILKKQLIFFTGQNPANHSTR